MFVQPFCEGHRPIKHTLASLHLSHIALLHYLPSQPTLLALHYSSHNYSYPVASLSFITPRNGNRWLHITHHTITPIWSHYFYTIFHLTWHPGLHIIHLTITPTWSHHFYTIFHLTWHPGLHIMHLIITPTWSHQFYTIFHHARHPWLHITHLSTPKHAVHRNHHLSLKREVRWGTTDDFTPSFNAVTPWKLLK